jgi:hypothetical protein
MRRIEPAITGSSLHARTEHEIDVALASLAQLRVGALVIASDAFFKLPIAALRHHGRY